MAEALDRVNEFRRCYNTSVETHCFAVQYDANNRTLVTSNDNARQRCNNLSSTLIVIKDEEINGIVKNYMSDFSNPISNQYVWTDAYQISDYSNSYTWHWLNSRLPTLAALEVTFLYDYKYYVTTLEFRSLNGTPQFYLTAKLPQEAYSYVCEYAVSRCPSTGSNVLQFSDRCYVSFSASVSWYEARNRCLKDGGDLASFANVTSINFTSWLGSDTNVRFWIGLRFTWYIWKDTGLDVKFINWIPNNDWAKLCLVTCSNCGASLGVIPTACSDVSYVVCHSVKPLEAITTGTVRTLPETMSTSMTTETLNPQSTQPWSNSSNSEKSAASSPIGVAVGVGVGVGVPVIVAIIVIVICVVRSGKRLEQKTRNDRTELGAVQPQTVEQVNDSVNDNNYEQLNRNHDNSSGSMYDKIGVAPEPNYEEFPPNNINT